GGGPGWGTRSARARNKDGLAGRERAAEGRRPAGSHGCTIGAPAGDCKEMGRARRASPSHGPPSTTTKASAPPPPPPSPPPPPPPQHDPPPPARCFPRPPDPPPPPARPPRRHLQLPRLVRRQPASLQHHRQLFRPVQGVIRQQHYLERVAQLRLLHDRLGVD